MRITSAHLTFWAQKHCPKFAIELLPKKPTVDFLINLQTKGREEKYIVSNTLIIIKHASLYKKTMLEKLIELANNTSDAPGVKSHRIVARRILARYIKSL